MNFNEIKTRLEAEGITPYKFDEEDAYLQSTWIGKVNIVDSRHNTQTKENLENRYHIYQLVDHDVYIKLNSVREEDYDEYADKNYNDDGDYVQPENNGWDYYAGFYEVEPTQVCYTEYHGVIKSGAAYQWRSTTDSLEIEVEVSKDKGFNLFVAKSKALSTVTVAAKTRNQTKQQFIDLMNEVGDSGNAIVLKELANLGWVDNGSNNIVFRFVDL